MKQQKIAMKSGLLLAGAGLLSSLLGGCVERKITIVSDPPGAQVWVNDVEMGRTPVEFPFTWYGDYDLKFRLTQNVGTPENPSYKYYYLHTDREAHAPIYDWMGIDIITESLIPFTFKDEKIWAVNIPESKVPADKDLVDRANALRIQMETPTKYEQKKAGKSKSDQKSTTSPAGTQPASPPATQP